MLSRERGKLNAVVVVVLFVLSEVHLTEGKCYGQWAIHACGGGNGKRSDLGTESNSAAAAAAANEEEGSRDQTQEAKKEEEEEEEYRRLTTDGPDDDHLLSESQQLRQSSGTKSRLRELLMRTYLIGTVDDETVPRDTDRTYLTKQDLLLMKRIFAVARQLNNPANSK